MSAEPTPVPLDPSTQAPDPGVTQPPEAHARRQTATPMMETPGTKIGVYKLLQRLGEGGMGTVWMAEQTEPVKRIVAVKVIKAGLDSSQVLARFDAERQALALMDHPNIAKVLDADTTDAGRPYFVMELVKGIPITNYCDNHHLTPTQRLELFIQVCNAIQHAHQKGIIHRDIKPGNILVADYDGKPVPKVIDFGLAKATAMKLTEHTMFTQIGGLMGTFEYMSPEQAEFNALDVDTRSDIYALGVLLYELLTGTTPLTRLRQKQAALQEVLRLIREEEPPKPSMRLSEFRDSLPSVAAQRKMEPARLTKQVRGELDWLVMKALEKDRNRRYDTANAFAQDVQRYLSDEPVLASPPSSLYRMRKFAKRHKGSLAAAALVLLALLAGIVGTSIGLVAAERQRDAAEQERQNAEAQRDRAVKAEADAKVSEEKARDKEAQALAVLDYFQDKVLAAARPKGQDGGLGVDATVRAAVDAAEAKIAESFKNEPLVEASIRYVLGKTYLYLGQTKEAIRQNERALEIRNAKLGPSHPDTVATMNNLAWSYHRAGRRTEAVNMFEETLKRREATFGLDHWSTLATMNGLASAYRDADRLDDAVALHEKTLKLMKAKLGLDNSVTLNAMNNLALDYQTARRLDEATALYEEAYKLGKAKLGPEDPATLMYMSNLANAYLKAGRLDEALALHQDALKLRKTALGPDHADTIASMTNLLAVYQKAGKHNDAEPLYRELVAMAKEKDGPESAHYARRLSGLGLNLIAQAKNAEAAAVLRDCLAIREKTLPDNWSTFDAKSQLGGSLLGQKQYADAERELLQGYEGMKQRAAQIPAMSRQHVTAALERLVQLYEATGDTEKAAKWRKEFENAKGKNKNKKYR